MNPIKMKAKRLIAKSDTIEELINAIEMAYSPSNEDGTHISKGDHRGNGDYGSITANAKKRDLINQEIADLIDGIKSLDELSLEDAEKIKQYAGGAKLGKIYEYFTPKFIAEGITQSLEANGFRGGNLCEPSAGTGVFNDAKPEGSIVTASEINPVSAKINKLLHPEDDILSGGFESIASNVEDNHFDGFFGNIPFGGNVRGKYTEQDQEYKRRYPKDYKNLEKYFIRRAIDKVKPGRLIVFVVPVGIIQNKTFSGFRSEISRKAEFLGAHKLPSDTFKNAGTPVVTDIIVLKKHPAGMGEKIAEMPENTLEELNVLWPEFIKGNYFKGEGRRFIHGDFVPAKVGADGQKEPGQFNQDKVISTLDNRELQSRLAQKFSSRIDWKALELEVPEQTQYSEGDTKFISGIQYEFLGGEWSRANIIDPTLITIDKIRYGAGSKAELISMFSVPTGGLEVSFEQAMLAQESFPEPSFIKGIQKKAIEIAKRAKPENQEQIYRGIILGNQAQELLSATNRGEDNSRDRDKLKEDIAAEISKFGHPYNNKSLMKEGGMSQEFNAFSASFDQAGKASNLLTGDIVTIANREKFNSADVTSIVEYLTSDEGVDFLTLEDLNKLYTGTGEFKTLSDLTTVENIAIAPSGAILPIHKYCSGSINPKIDDLNTAIAKTSDQRLKDKYQEQIDLMESKRKITPMEDIAFTPRQRWMDKELVKEFGKANGLHLQFGYEDEDGNFVEDDTAVPGKWELIGGEKNWAGNPADAKRVKQWIGFLNGHKIKEATIRGKVDPKERAALKKQAFLEDNEFLQNFNEEFQAFIQTHPDADKIHQDYNRTFNANVEYDYPENDLGLDLPDWLIPHGYQNAEVRRLSELGNGICGFNVGLGKTFTALLLDKFNKKAKRSTKTCIVVPNSVITNWYNETKVVYGSMSDVLVIGASPVLNKEGNVNQERVKDSEGKDKFKDENGEKVYQTQDELRKDNASEIKKKLFSIPSSSKKTIVIQMSTFNAIPMRPDSRQKFMDKHTNGNAIGNADAVDFVFGDEGKDLVTSARKDFKDSGGKGKSLSYKEAKKGAKFEELSARSNANDKGEYPFWEDLGFDSFMIDESHTYKNSFVHGMGDYKYLSKPVASSEALGATAKADFIRASNNGKGTYSLSATPVTNSPTEIWNALSMVSDMAELAQYGITDPDSFMMQFCKFDAVKKVSLSGEKKSGEGLVGFQNLGALRGIFGKYASIKDANDVGLKMPDFDSHTDAVEMTFQQATIYEKLQKDVMEAAKKKKSGEIMSIFRKMQTATSDIELYQNIMTFKFDISKKDKVDEMLKSLPDEKKWEVKKILLDVEGNPIKKMQTVHGERREVNAYEIIEKKITKEQFEVQEVDGVYEVSVPITPSSIGVSYEPDVIKSLSKFGLNEGDFNHNIPPKYAKLIENIKSGYDIDKDGKTIHLQGKHIVFTEEKQQHQKLARILFKNLPVELRKIVVINGDTASDTTVRGKMAEDFNSGKYAIAIANKIAEVGLNMQKGQTGLRAVQIHHLDMRWTPASLTQRDGRIIRQGNESEFVRSSKYVAAGSSDMIYLQTLQSKEGWIDALLKGDKEEIENDGSDESVMEEMMAAISEDPEAYRENKRLEREVKAKLKKERAMKAIANSLSQISNMQDFLSGSWEIDKKEEKIELDSLSQKIEDKVSSLKENLSNDILSAKEAKQAIAEQYPFIKDVDFIVAGEAMRLILEEPNVAITREYNSLAIDDKEILKRLNRKAGKVEETKSQIIKQDAKLVTTKRALTNLDTKYESMIEQRTKLLRSKKGALKQKKNLPFDVSVIDNPDSALITMDGNVIQEGDVYEFDGDIVVNQYNRGKNKDIPYSKEGLIGEVIKINQKNQTFTMKGIVGFGTDNSYRNDAEEVTYSLLDLKRGSKVKGLKKSSLSKDELNLKAILASEVKYSEIPDKISKEVFHENKMELSFTGYVLVEKNAKLVIVNSWNLDENFRKMLVYPDKNDEKFKEKAMRMYLDEEKEGSTSYEARSLMESFFGDGYKAIAISEYGNSISKDKFLNLVKKMEIDETINPTFSQWRYIVKQNSDLNKFDNIDEIANWGAEYQRSLYNKYDEIRKLRAAEELAKQEAEKTADMQKKTKAAKMHPDYKEIPDDLKNKFEALDIIITPNMSRIHGNQPFSRWFIHDKNGFDGIIAGSKKSLAKKFSSLSDLSGMKGELNGYGNSDTFWWSTPSTNSLQNLYDEVIQQLR